MFQALLKTGTTKPLPKTKSQADNNLQPTNQPRNLQDDSWASPISLQYPNNHPETEIETPGFLDRVSKLSRKIENAQRDIVSGFQLKSSEIVQVKKLMSEEQSQAQYMNINKQSTVPRLNFLRMRNAVSEMRQAHFDLTEYLEDERRLMGDFHQKICMDIEDFFNEYRQKLVGNNNQSQVDSLKRENTMLRQRMERKEIQLQKVSRDFEQFKAAQQQKPNEANKAMAKEDIITIKCSNCRALELRTTELAEQLRRSEEQIDKLLIENQRLQEYIFDIEQKIAGVDLEVQRRIKERMLDLPELQTQMPHNPVQLQKLKQQMHNWELKYQRLEQSARKAEQTAKTAQQSSYRNIELDLREQNLNKKEQQLRNYELTILESQKHLEQLKQANYQREREILSAEDNLNKKMSDLRNKENDLSRWEAELTWKANETKNRPLSKPKLQIEDFNYPADEQIRRINQPNYRVKDEANQIKPNYLNQIKNSRQMSIKSFGRRPPQDLPHQGEVEQRLSPRMMTHQHDYQLKNYQASHTRGEYYENRYETGKRRVDTRPHLENEYINKNREHYNHLSRKPGLTGSHYNREHSPYQNVVQMRSRANHHVGVVTSTGNYRELSKSSRHSAAKSMKSAYVPVAKSDGQLLGLGNKLQRLREQIKKEIESIK